MKKRQKPHSFVLEQCLLNSINAAIKRHPNFYNAKTKKSKERDEVRKIFGKAIVENAKTVIDAINTKKPDQENILIKSINEIMKTLKLKCGGKLKNGRVSFGVAQKAFNLFLKYLWCMGVSGCPPHCPIDNQVLEKIDWKNGGKGKWSAFDESRYKAAIKLIKGRTIAEWELSIWQPSLKICFDSLFD